MPIPKPHSGESRSDFMGRCVSFLRSEGRDEDQAVAICSQQWQGKGMLPVCQTEAQKTMYWKSFDRRRWQFLRKYENMFKRALNKQVQPVLDSLGDESEALATAELIDDEPIFSAMALLYRQVGSYYANDIMSGLKGASQDMETKNEDQFIETMNAYMSSIGAPLVETMTDNTKKAIRKIIEKGIDEGLGTEEIARNIQNSGNIAGRVRARAIARTEIIRASNYGSITGAQQSGLALKKQWLATRDGRVRTDHEVAGMHPPILMEQDFKVGSDRLNYPGDPDGTPKQTINCRCTLIYEPL